MKNIKLLLLVSAAWIFGATLSVSPAAAEGPYNISTIVMPHADDEIEAWSLIENSPANYKVFAYMTLGEETKWCIPSNYANSFQPHYNEVAPATTPLGKWTSSCETARISSTLGFLNKMSAYDSTIPSGFSMNNYTTVNLPNPGGYGHEDHGSTTVIPDESVRVYHSTNGYGKALFFNLGDGDLTQEEVEWAVSSIMTNRASLDLPSYPFYNAIGGFYNKHYPNCVVYAHPDHYSVHRALYHHNFGFTAYQTAATCASDPDTVRTKNISWTPWYHGLTVKPDGERYGYVQRWYGWLHYSGLDPTNGWKNDPSLSTQNALFMRHQSFWQRF